MGFRLADAAKNREDIPTSANVPSPVGQIGATGQWEPAGMSKPINVTQPPIGSEYAKGSPEQMLSVTQPQAQPYSEATSQRTFVDPKTMSAFETSQAKMKEALAQSVQAEAEQGKIRAAAFEEQNKVIKQRQAELDNVMTEYKNAKIVDPMGEWGTARKIGAAIAMGLGAYAAAYTGGKNHAAEIIGDAVKRDLDLQESRINKLGLDAKNAQGALADATRKLGDIGQARTALEIAALTNAKEDVMKLAQASDNKKVQANANAQSAAIDEKIAELAAQLNRNTVTTSTVTGVKPGAKTEAEKPMTEAQSKAFAFATMMDKAEKDLTSVEKYGATKTGAAAGMAPEFLKSQERKQFEQATSAWSEAYLRWASGANVPDKEIKANIERAMPRVGDSEKILEQKKEYRKTLMNTVMEISGRGATQPKVDVKKQLQFSGR